MLYRVQNKEIFSMGYQFPKDSLSLAYTLYIPSVYGFKETKVAET